MATLDYVMVTAIIFPLTFVLTVMFIRTLEVIFQLVSATVGWPFP